VVVGWGRQREPSRGRTPFAVLVRAEKVSDFNVDEIWGLWVMQPQRVLARLGDATFLEKDI